MARLKLLVLVLFIFSFTNCEKKEVKDTPTKDVQVVGFVTDKCFCCWGWVIKIGSDTIKSESIPGLSIADNQPFPINAAISIGSKTIECGADKFDYYEITSFTRTK